jgi:hypothetical protein
MSIIAEEIRVGTSEVMKALQARHRTQTSTPLASKRAYRQRYAG